MRLSALFLASCFFLLLPLFSSSAALTSWLGYGSRGTQVTELQNFLKGTKDFTGSATGYFGSSTETALKKYQAREGIVSSGTPAVTGYGAVGPCTRAHINAAMTGGAKPTCGQTGTYTLPTTTGGSSSSSGLSVTFTASSAEIRRNSTTALSWTSTSARSCDLSGRGTGNASDTTSGSFTTPRLSSSAIYGITCRDANGRRATAKITITISSDPDDTGPVSTTATPSGASTPTPVSGTMPPQSSSALSTTATCSSQRYTSSVPFASRLFEKAAICVPKDPFVIIFHQHPVPGRSLYGPWLVGGTMTKEEWKNVYRHVGHIGPYALIRAYETNGSWSSNSDMVYMLAAQELGRASGGGFYDVPSGATEAKARSLFRESIGLNITHWAHDDEPETSQIPMSTDVLARWKKWYVDEMLAARQEAGKPAPKMITNWLISDNPSFLAPGVNGLSSFLAAGFTHGDWIYYVYARQGTDVFWHLFSQIPQLNANRNVSKQKSVNSIAPFSNAWLGNAEIDIGYGSISILPAAEYASLITLGTLEGTKTYFIFTSMSEGRLGSRDLSTADGARFNADAIYEMAKAASWFESTKNSIKNSTYAGDTPLQNKSGNIIFRSRTNGTEMWFAGVALNGSASAQVSLPTSSGTLTNLSTGQVTQVSGGVSTVPLSRITNLYYFKP